MESPSYRFSSTPLDTLQVCQSVNLIKNDEFVSKDLAMAEVFNHYFINISKELEIGVNTTQLSTTHEIDDPIDIAIIICYICFSLRFSWVLCYDFSHFQAEQVEKHTALYITQITSNNTSLVYSNS